ncbi:apoptosis-inducing taf9-like domain 1 family protein [Rutstroemia sp. NJR-2017a BBW]|nr:apoptosis-inducing taf9-like domain 1 family protein [Rutstroemia sp. NJR-2017a BBW]
MPQEMDEALQEGLKAALWFSIGKIVDEESIRLNANATNQFIGALTEMVWAQIENVTMDLESFAQHAGRTTITTDDVLLITRRNDALYDIMKDFIDKEKAKSAKNKERNRRFKKEIRSLDQVKMSDTHQAQSQVLRTPELLDHILSYLPQSCLLLNITRVCKAWNTALSSPTLQRALGFRSDPKVESISWPELLERQFSLFYQLPPELTLSDASSLKTLPWTQCPDVFNRADASWRRMLVFQPACTRFEIVQVVAQRTGIWRQKCVINCEDGIRMGMLWDIIQKWCSKRNHWFMMDGHFEPQDNLSSDTESTDNEDHTPVPRSPSLILKCHRTWHYGGTPLLEDSWISKARKDIYLDFRPVEG